MTEHTSLADELHDLAADIAPTGPATNHARDRARRGIVRHRRNQRAAIAGLATVVVVAGVTAAVALGHDSRHSAPPAGQTTVAPTTTPHSAPSTAPPPSATTPPAPSPIRTTVPDWSAIPAATPGYTERYPWGRAADEVAFSVPQGEGASGGPLAFTADRIGTVALLDHSNARIVRRAQGPATVADISGLSPAVTAAVFDAQGRVIVATVDDLAVDGPDGRPEGSWPHITNDPHGIYELEVDGTGVYWRHGGLDAGQGGATRTELLRDNGAGYIEVAGTPEPDEITGSIDDQAHLTTLRVTATGMEYRIATSGTDVWAARALPDGSFVFVLQPYPGDQGAPETRTYIVGYVDRAGHATYSKVDAPMGYLVNGPVFDIDDDGLAVMSSTIADGVTISYYRY